MFVFGAQMRSVQKSRQGLESHFQSFEKGRRLFFQTFSFSAENRAFRKFPFFHARATKRKPKKKDRIEKRGRETFTLEREEERAKAPKKGREDWTNAGKRGLSRKAGLLLMEIEHQLKKEKGVVFLESEDGMEVWRVRRKRTKTSLGGGK